MKKAGQAGNRQLLTSSACPFFVIYLLYLITGNIFTFLDFRLGIEEMSFCII
jgi:hypothetical protein